MSYHPKRDEIAYKHHVNTTNRFNNMNKTEYQEWCDKFKGENNPMFGKHHTKETCEKISIANTGKNSLTKGLKLEEIVGEDKAEQIKEKLSILGKTRTGSLNPFYGKHHSEETRKLLSEKNTGKRNPNCWKKVKADGKQFNSISDAAKELGVTSAAVIYRIKSKNFTNYNYL